VSLRGEDGVVREKKWAAGAPDLGIAFPQPLTRVTIII
jgi:hypothetical protein